METKIYTINLKNATDTIYLEPLGCIHIGNVNFNKEKFEARIEAIKKDPNRYWIGMGDYGDSITVSNTTTDKRFSWRTIDRKVLTPDEQFDYVEDSFKPITSKCLGLLEGNHDWKLIDKTTHGYVQKMAKNLDVSWLKLASFITLRFVHKGDLLHRVLLFAAHGQYKGGQTGGNLSFLENLPSRFDADIYLTGHTHNAFTAETQILSVDEHGHLVHQPRIFASTGSFLEGYVQGNMSYVEYGLKRATKTGTITIAFQPSEKKMFTIQ